MFLRLLRILMLVAVWLVPAGVVHAQVGASNTVRTDQVTATLLAHAPQGVPTGAQAQGEQTPVWLGLQLQHAPQWHTYWKNAGDSGLPTELRWKLPPGVLASDIQWPAPQKIRIGDLANFGYEGTVLLPVRLIVTPEYQPPILADAMDVELGVTWLVCKEECIPQDAQFQLKLPLAGSTALYGQEFQAAFDAQPTDLGQEVASATVQGDGQRLSLRVSDLPAELQGQRLQLFPETPEILMAAARRAEQPGPDTWTQHWDGAAWVADLPVWRWRSESPQHMPFVLTAGDHSWRVDAAVQGNWPQPADPAEVSPALAAALSANASAAASAPVAPPAPASVPITVFLLALLGAMVGGAILNLMPCVFPILAIKVLGFARHGSSSGAHRADGLAYTLGVLLSFLALGALMLALRAAGQGLGWGFQLQSPTVVALLATLFVVIGLNLAGVFEFGRMLPSGLVALQLRNPLLNSALSGVLAVAVASPCTAPFMGAALGLAIGLPAIQALAIFGAIGLGMALPYLLASWVPAVARRLPRPGPWMDVFKKFMSFPMFATAIWLLWVLGQQSGVDGAAALMALLLVLAFALWALSLAGRARWFTGTVAALAAVVLVPALLPQVLTPQPALAAQAAPGGHWQPWSEERVQALLTAGDPVFVDFTAAWCVTCQVNKRTTLTRPAVLQSLDSAGVHTLRADWTRRDERITAALHQIGRSGVPAYVLYAPGQEPVVLSELISASDIDGALQHLRL